MSKNHDNVTSVREDPGSLPTPGNLSKKNFSQWSQIRGYKRSDFNSDWQLASFGLASRVPSQES
jgi:hypothetical protein